jgi:hypothetical protein
MSPEASCIIDLRDDRSTFVEHCGDRGGQVALDLQSGNAPTLSRLACGAFQQTARDIVAITAIAFDA